MLKNFSAFSSNIEILWYQHTMYFVNLVILPCFFVLNIAFYILALRLPQQKALSTALCLEDGSYNGPVMKTSLPGPKSLVCRCLFAYHMNTEIIQLFLHLNLWLIFCTVLCTVAPGAVKNRFKVSHYCSAPFCKVSSQGDSRLFC